MTLKLTFNVPRTLQRLILSYNLGEIWTHEEVYRSKCTVLMRKFSLQDQSEGGGWMNGWGV